MQMAGADSNAVGDHAGHHALNHAGKNHRDHESQANNQRVNNVRRRLRARVREAIETNLVIAIDLLLKRNAAIPQALFLTLARRE